MTAISNVPEPLQNLGAWLIFIGLIVGGTYLTPLKKPIKWLFRRNISEPLGAWFKKQVAEELEPTAHLVEYHLGPNSGTTAIHERLARLETQILSE